MIEADDLRDGHEVLEPSAGTGAITSAVLALRRCAVTAVEIDPGLCTRLRASVILNRDFLSCSDLGPFDRVLMKPPFAQGADIRHINHASRFLKPGGMLVAICANGPRQQSELRPLATTWEELPDDAFAAEGTRVRTVLFTIHASLA